MKNARTMVADLDFPCEQCTNTLLPAFSASCMNSTPEDQTVCTSAWSVSFKGSCSCSKRGSDSTNIWWYVSGEVDGSGAMTKSMAIQWGCWWQIGGLMVVVVVVGGG